MNNGAAVWIEPASVLQMASTFERTDADTGTAMPLLHPIQESE